MTQISRPIQITLAAAVLFLAVWFIALRGHSASTSSGSSSSAPPPAGSASQASSAHSVPGGGTPASNGQVYHGSAPGVEGLSRAIKRAQGAVAQSQQNANQLQRKSREASSGAQGQTQDSRAQSGQHAQARTGESQRSQPPQRQGQNSQAQQQQHGEPASGVPAMQAVVESELAHGKTVAVLFWNPKGAVDATVRRELQAAGRARHGKLAIHVARSSEVGSFGSFTHTVQVYSTPTILLINPTGKTSSLAGLADLFSIEQAIKEVQKVR